MIHALDAIGGKRALSAHFWAWMKTLNGILDKMYVRFYGELLIGD